MSKIIIPYGEFDSLNEKAGSNKEVEYLTDIIMALLIGCRRIWHDWEVRQGKDEKHGLQLDKISFSINFNTMVVDNIIMSGAYSHGGDVMFNSRGFEEIMYGETHYDLFDDSSDADFGPDDLYSYKVPLSIVTDDGFSQLKIEYKRDKGYSKGGGSMGGWNWSYTAGRMELNGNFSKNGTRELRSLVNHEANHLFQNVKKYKSHRKKLKAAKTAEQITDVISKGQLIGNFNHYSPKEKLYYRKLKDKFNGYVYKKFNRLIYLSTTSEMSSRITQSVEELKQLDKDMKRKPGWRVGIADNEHTFKRALRDTTGWENMMELKINIIGDIIKTEKFIPYKGWNPIKRVEDIKKRAEHERQEINAIIIFVQGWMDTLGKDITVSKETAMDFINKWAKVFDKAADKYYKKLVRTYSHFEKSEQNPSLQTRLSTHKSGKRVPEMVEKRILDYRDFNSVDEGKLDKKPFDPHFAVKASTLAAYLKDQIESIAQDLAMEKHLRDPKNYPSSEVTDIDRSRAMQLIFHSDWRKLIIDGKGGEFVNNARHKAEKKDKAAHKKNHATNLNMDDKKTDFIGPDTEEGFGFHKKDGEI